MLSVRGASFSYGRRPALRDVSLDIGQGALIALLGANGSGKSTLLKLMARVVPAQSGTVRLLDRPLTEWSARDYARQTGYLPQEPESSFPMRALDVVVTGRAPFLSRFGFESDDDFARAAAALARCDAAHLAERFLDQMSGGERKRVFLARVLTGEPRLILLDEPLAALDVAHMQQFSRLLRDIVDSTGATVVFASHDLNWAAAYSDRIVILDQGSLAADLAPAQLMEAGLVRRHFGFDAQIIEVNGRPWLVPDRQW